MPHVIYNLDEPFFFEPHFFSSLCIQSTSHGKKGKAIPVTGCEGP
jgi:hypothetical protein